MSADDETTPDVEPTDKVEPTGEVKGDTTTLEDFTVIAKLREGDE